ncbi:hypothetical protein RJ640_018993 [Escallonia rubra]|uniref:F-box/kelch-repeat protein n=1 Tax=Escallonia rubra TaxID=112253 RepID=A0AA88U093_9ASTE|nr:hypothetical protein RJ640_018993 [Escallonia rubra]
MNGDESWFDNDINYSRKGTGVFHPNLGHLEKEDKECNPISLDSVLPDVLQEKFLASLPIACVVKACCVCKKWNGMVHSKKFVLDDADVLSHNPWYFMFTGSDEPVGFVYDSILQKWYGFEFPLIIKDTWIAAPSCGLVCFMDEESSSELHVCNPITRDYKKLEAPLDPIFSVYSALAFSVDRESDDYTVAVVRSRQPSDYNQQWEASIHVYNSQTMIWVPPVVGSLEGWRAGNVSVICDGILYFLVYSTRVGEIRNSHGLLSYNLNKPPSSGELMDTFISAPCALTCGRLMNLNNELVMVGGVGRQDRPGIIRGIRVWVLKGRDWEEVSRMPPRFFQGFGELDDVFAGTGAGDLIYIQSYGATVLAVFDIKLNQWTWSQKCPMSKRSALQLFSGFCFEPRLGVSP